MMRRSPSFEQAILWSQAVTNLSSVARSCAFSSDSADSTQIKFASDFCLKISKNGRDEDLINTLRLIELNFTLQVAGPQDTKEVQLKSQPFQPGAELKLQY